MASYEIDQIYDRGTLHADASNLGLKPGNRTAGITVIGGELCVFWNPYRRLYANTWLTNPTDFAYSGEGGVGDMEETGGNAHLLESENNATPVDVFYKVQATGSRWRYLGAYGVVSHAWGWSPDTTGAPRRDLRFFFSNARYRIEASTQPVPTVVPRSPSAPPSEAELWAAAQKKFDAFGYSRTKRTQTRVDQRQSDPLKSLYALQRAARFGGGCELCGHMPDWTTEQGTPHYQVHHLSRDVDMVDWIAALCGTCHDRMHHSSTRMDDTAKLRDIIADRQLKLGRPLYYLGAE